MLCTLGWMRRAVGMLCKMGLIKATTMATSCR